MFRRLALTLAFAPLTASALTNGVPLDRDDARAVVSVAAPSAYGGNTWGSGFFVGPDVVLTAKHCVSTGSKEGVVIDGEWTVADVRAREPVMGEEHSLDLALLRVNYSNRDYYSIATRVAPSPGEVVDLYGFGPALDAAGNEDGSAVKRKGFAPISRVNDAFILTEAEMGLPYDASAASGAIEGDSGGPMLLDGIAIGVAAKGGWGPSTYTNLLSARAQKFLRAAARDGWDISFAK